MPYDFAERPSMSEVELLARFIEHARLLEETARGLAHSRKDDRWLKVARLVGQIRDKGAMVANARMTAN